jgi:hypothetical protein
VDNNCIRFRVSGFGEGGIETFCFSGHPPRIVTTEMGYIFSGVFSFFFSEVVVDNISIALTRGFLKFRLTKIWPLCKSGYSQLRFNRLHLEQAGRKRSHCPVCQ